MNLWVFNYTNIWFMSRVDAEQQAQEARFVDLAWAGKQGTVSYPGFLNANANWPVADPDGKPIEQASDRAQLQQSIKLCEDAANAARSRRAMPPTASSQSHGWGSLGRVRQAASFHHPQPYDKILASCR